MFLTYMCFVLFWLWKAPYTFLTLIKAVCPTCVDDNVYELAFWLLWVNSTLNPILYPFLHIKFRLAFIRILKCICCCCSCCCPKSRQGVNKRANSTTGTTIRRGALGPTRIEEQRSQSKKLKVKR